MILEENIMFVTVSEIICNELMGSDDEEEEVNERVPRPMHTSFYTGNVWVHNILNGHEKRCSFR